MFSPEAKAKLVAASSAIAYVVVLWVSASIISQVLGASPRYFVLLFWPFLFLDLPRYLIPDVLVFLRACLFDAKKAPAIEGAQPLISVVVPAHNEIDTIGPTLESIFEADYPRKEIIVVDDGSTDGTHTVVQPYADKGDVVLLRKQRGGKASALNTGASLARGEVIVTVDSDTVLPRDGVRRIARYFDDPELDALACNLRVKNTDQGLLTRLQDCEYSTSINLGKRFLSWIGALFVISGAFGAFRRRLLSEVGQWDPGIGDDSNVTIKVKKSKRGVTFAPEIIALTSVPCTLRGLYRQRKRWEKSFIRNRFKKHGDILRMDRFGSIVSLSILGEFFFRVVLLFLFYYYFVWVLLFRPISNFLLVMAFAWVMYAGLNHASLAIAASLSDSPEDWRNLIYGWLVFPYRIFLRIPRTVAFIEEFTGWHYRHPFYPDLVWENAPVWTLSKGMIFFMILYGGIVVMIFARTYELILSLMG